MTLIQSLILSLVQGITEFLPISSSGHLNLFQHFFNLKPSLTLDVFLNTATLLSVLFFFRKQISYFFKNLKYIIVASIPAALVGIFFKDQVDSIFSIINLLPFFFILGSLFVFFTKFISPKNTKVTYSKAILIGLFQSIAILPGVSRAGATIFMALLLGLSTIEAFNFSFCLFIPASLGALVLNLKDLSTANVFTPQYLLSFVLTFITGIIALTILKKVLISHKFWIFAIYLIILSFTLFFIL